MAQEGRDMYGDTTESKVMLLANHLGREDLDGLRWVGVGNDFGTRITWKLIAKDGTKVYAKSFDRLAAAFAKAANDEHWSWAMVRDPELAITLALIDIGIR